PGGGRLAAVGPVRRPGWPRRGPAAGPAWRARQWPAGGGSPRPAMPASAPQAKDEDDPALGGSRAALRDAYRAPEASRVAMLLPQARLPADAAAAARNLARRLTVGLRKRQAGGRAGMIQELLREFSLSSQEGVA